MIVQAEVSLYALGERDLAPAINTFLRRLDRPGLAIEIGRLSSLVTGENDLVKIVEAYKSGPVNVQE